MKIEDIKTISNGEGLKALRLRTILTLEYFWRTRKLTLFVFILFVLFIILYAYIEGIVIKDWDSLGSLFNIGTLLVVLAVWWSELKEDWRNSLPKYISAIFEFKGSECKEFSYTEYALVSHEGDIRSLSQQLGAQKNDGDHLKFDPTKYRIEPKLKYGSCENRCKFAFWHFTLYGALTELPDKKDKKDKKTPPTNVVIEKLEGITVILEKSLSAQQEKNDSN